MRIGVFGSSFNPPTKGHEDVVNQALEVFDSVLLVPSVLHPFGKESLPLHYRLDMLRLFIEPWQRQNPAKNVKIFNIEALIQAKDPKKEKIYTFDVLCELEQYYQSIEKTFTLQFIIGPDNADPAIWKKFHLYDEIEKRWGVWVAKENYAIRSTDVRALVASQSNKHECYELYPKQMIFPVGAKPLSNRSVYEIHKDCEVGEGNNPENSSVKSILLEKVSLSIARYIIEHNLYQNRNDRYA